MKVREGCRVSVNYVEMFIRYWDEDYVYKDDFYNYVIIYF